MKFAPVFLPDDRRFNGRISQTALRHYDRCPRSAYLYALYKGEASTVEMIRGVAVHEILERCIRACVENGEVTIPGEVAKAIVDEVLAEQHVPLDQHDYIRESVYRWASETAVDPSAVIACETLIVLEVEGWQVRMKVDYATALEGGAAVLVQDWKSGQGMPTQEEVARKRSTPLAGGGVAAALMAKSFQLVLYALGLRYGRPVRVEECLTCEGEGMVASNFNVDSPNRPNIVACPTCDRKGTVEIVEPFPLAERAQRFDLEYVFPGIEDREGKMGRRSMSLTPAELDAYLQSLRGLLRRVAASEATGDWPAQTSDAACSECPAPLECPIPRELRDHAGRINTPEEAAEAAEKADRERALAAAKGRELKAWAKANGGRVRFGADKVFEFVPTSAEEIRDKDALWLAIERAVQYGDPFEKADHVKTKQGTSFKVRTLSADELAAEAAEEENDGNDRDAGLDERFGADAPW